MWPFRKKTLTPIYPFRSLILALIAKDAVLYRKISHLPPSEFRVEWQKTYPEDFPIGGMSPPDARSVIPRKDR